MPEPFIKRFDDRYTQSREYQFLDLLNQLNAAVPAVISNESLEGLIKMEHVGVNLNEWLLTIAGDATGQELAFDALHQALEISCTVAKKDVWHFDLAARNFMVEQPSGVASPKVRLIDFSLAVSKRFPLEKPLWMRPDKQQQHPALVAALQTDWENFFHRHNLAKPNFESLDFEIPMAAYQADWGTGLAADQLLLPWCVVTHSIGIMLTQAAQCACFSQGAKQQLGIHAHQLLNLDSEAAAQIEIKAVMLWMRSQMNSLTPRPKPRLARQEYAAKTQAPAALYPSSPKEGPPAIQATAARQEKDKPRLAIPLFGKTLVAGLVIRVAYFLIDTIYLAFQITASTYTLGLTLIIVSISVILLLALLISNRRRGIIRLLSKVHGLSLWCFALELWVRQVPDPWVIGLSLIGLILFNIKY